MIPETNLDEIKDECYRRILTLQRFRDYPFNVEDENAVLDILKILVNRVIELEKTR